MEPEPVMLQQVNREVVLQTNRDTWWTPECAMQKQAEEQGVPAGLRPTIVDRSVHQPFRADLWEWRWNWTGVERVKQAVPWDDGTCGDCAERSCHGGDPDYCGCARHDASQADADE